MRKLVVSKDETAPALIEKISAELAPEITLVIPKNSVLKDSVGSFELIARAAQEADKRVSVESVDEDILDLARANNLGANHPLFSSDVSRPLADILPRTKPDSTVKVTKKRGKKTVSVSVPVESENASAKSVVPKPTVELPKFTPNNLRVIAPPLEVEPAEEVEPRKSFFKRPKVWLIVVGLVVLIGLGLWIATAFFGRVTVVINFRKAQFDNSNSFAAGKSTTEINSDQRTIPGELFRDRRNTTQLFPASGRANVNQRATGELTIYNAYNSKPQILVATTRFQTPDGKIFRLDKQVTVPGAEVANGKITPASITATVTADSAGPAFNLGTIDKLTIPGFKSDAAHYAGFYGALLHGTSGGFIGDRGVPTAKDIADAKAKTSSILTTDLTNNFLSARPAQYKILDGASSVVVTKLTVNPATDDKNNFSVFGEAEYQAIGFREDDLRTVLLVEAAQSQPDEIFEKVDITYSNVKPNFTDGSVQFTAHAQGTLRPNFAPDQFKQSILGLGLAEAQTLTGKLPNLGDAKLSLWPIWLSRIPKDPSRVTIQTN